MQYKLMYFILTAWINFYILYKYIILGLLCKIILNLHSAIMLLLFWLEIFLLARRSRGNWQANFTGNTESILWKINRFLPCYEVPINIVSKMESFCSFSFIIKRYCNGTSKMWTLTKPKVIHYLDVSVIVNNRHTSP